MQCNKTEVTTMAESSDNAVQTAEDAYAAAAAVAPGANPAVAEVAKAKPVTKKPVAAKSRTDSRPRRAAVKAKRPATSAPHSTLTELKEQIMATARTTDFAKPFADAVSDAQSKAKAAYDKSAALAAEVTEFAKGNVEAVVESTKVYAAGVQDLSKTYVEEAKATYETLTADMKEFASVKSPAELFQLQARLARRNFDSLVAYSSKHTDAVSKLASETFAPISGRVSLAAETISKAA